MYYQGADTFAVNKASLELFARKSYDTVTVPQKYQHVPGFVIDDILSCLLVTNRKLSWGTFLECHVTSVTKRRINTMFRTNLKPDYSMYMYILFYVDMQFLYVNIQHNQIARQHIKKIIVTVFSWVDLVDLIKWMHHLYLNKRINDCLFISCFLPAPE